MVYTVTTSVNRSGYINTVTSCYRKFEDAKEAFDNELAIMRERYGEDAETSENIDNYSNLEENEYCDMYFGYGDATLTFDHVVLH